MSTESPIIVGLDIGTTKVAAIAGRKNEYGKLEILGYGRAESIGVDHGMVVNIEQCIKSIMIAIENCLISNPQLSLKEVYVGIAGRHIKSMQTRGEHVRTNAEDMITKADIEKLIQDQFKTFIPAGDQIIDIIPQDYTIDGQGGILNAKGRTGVKIGANFHIITGDKAAIRNINRCVKDTNLEISDLVLQPLASAAAVMSAEELEAGVAIVDIGGGTTDLAVFHDGILLHTSVIPYAGVNITLDIKNGLNVLKVQAEQLKIQFGNALSDEAPNNEFITIPGIKGAPHREISTKNLSHIIQSRMEEILEHVMYQLRQHGLDKKLGAGIILTGGGCQLKHLKQLTEYATGYTARIGHPNEHLASGYDAELDKPIYATCIGLILRGFDDYENKKMRFSSTIGNSLMHAVGSKKEEVIEEDLHEEDIVAESEEIIAKGPSKMDEIKRKFAISKIFGNVRRSIFTIFEEVDDKELDTDDFK
jgi:cell division protein FtsA